MESITTSSPGVGRRLESAALVGAQAAHGAFWTILFSVLNKLATFGSQIALAWFLLPEEMGLVAMALSVTSVASLISGANLRTVLIQRPERFSEDAGEVFWLSLSLNLAAALAVAALAPAAGALFHEPKVVPLMLIVAAAIPFMALPTVYSALLYRDLRFRSIARIQCGEGLIRSGASVALAALGCGASSIVLPMLASAIYAAIACPRLAGRIPLGRPRPRRWPALLVPAFWLMGLALATALQSCGTNFVIGLTHSSAVAGIYYWGFSFSSQATFLLAANLQGVLFPVLSRLNCEPSRQGPAFVNACRMLTLVIVPLCVLQIVLARPLLELFFHERWLPAVPVVQWLSIGMLAQPLGILAAALLMARGRYRLLAGVTACMALVVTAAAAIGAQLGGAAEIARCTGLGLLLANLGAGWIGYREVDPSRAAFLRKIALPVAVVFPLGLAGWLLAHFLGSRPSLIAIIAATLLFLVLHGVMVRQFQPRLVQELVSKIKPGRWLVKETPAG